MNILKYMHSVKIEFEIIIKFKKSLIQNSQTVFKCFITNTKFSFSYSKQKIYIL